MDKNLPARPAEVRCMIQGIQSRCTGTTQRDGIGREVRDRGDTCALVADSCKCMAKTTTISSVRSLSRVRPFATPWTAARKASLDLANSRSLLKLMPIKLVMPSNYFILCCLLLLLAQHQGLSQGVSSLHQVAKVLEFQLQHQSFQ